MAAETIDTQIRSDGLRYVAKSAGSNPFPGAPGTTISCLCCGRHMPRSTLVSFQLAGKRQFRCRNGC